MSGRPAYFEPIRQRAEKRWEQLECDPELAGPWHQLFKQVQSPRHILSELLQNADDAGATEATARIDDDLFIFEHNGEDFSEDNFASLCRFGYSNKRALHTIGFRGIGFKSTFSLGDQVELYTPTLSVGFEKARFTQPFWIESQESSTNVTRVQVKIQDKHRKLEVQKNLEEWTDSPVSLLFFKNIRKIKIGDDKIVHWVPLGKGPVERSQWFALQDSTDEKFLLVRSELESFPEEALHEIRQERLLSGEQALEFPPCQIEIVVGVEGRLYVVLPTGIETQLPFAVNGPFIQDPTRFKIKSPSISPTNRWLLERAGNLAANVLREWLERSDLPLSERALAYDVMPDIDREDASLEGLCSTLVEEVFEAKIGMLPIVLTEDGHCVCTKEAISLPEGISDVWSLSQAITFFDESARPSVATDINSRNIEKLKNWNAIEEIGPQAVLDVLQKRHLPQPKSWQHLISLWSFISSLLQSYKYYADKSALRIVPAQGKDILYSASEIIRLGEQRIVPAEEDWQFLGEHLSVLNQNWPRYLTSQRRIAETNKDNLLRRAIEKVSSVFREIGLDEPSDTSKVIDTVALAFFSQEEVTLNDAIRIAQIAAKLGAQIGDNFRFVSRDMHFRTIDETVLFDEDGSLDLLLPEEWSQEHLLHEDYSKSFHSCSSEEWKNWVTFGRSGLANFVPFVQTNEFFWSTNAAQTELSRRGFSGQFKPRYTSPDFRFEDWDFSDDVWEHWETLSEEMPSVWGQVAEKLLSFPRQLSLCQTANVIERASNGHTRRIINRGLTPSWASKLESLPCLRDTHGIYRKPTELLMRTPETESLMDVEPFVHGLLDSEATRPWLKLIGVSDKPTGPEKLLSRIRALANTEFPPLHEVDKWTRRLDQLIESCSTEDFNLICNAFQSERLIMSEAGTWENSEGIFLGSGEELIPDTPLVRSSTRDLMLWRKIGVSDRPTVELSLSWLDGIESGTQLSADDLRRVRNMLPSFPARIWNSCGHWLNLAGDWAPVSSMEYCISMQTLTHFSHLHPWVKKKTADFRNLPSEIAEAHPFSELTPLSTKVEERIEVEDTDVDRGELLPWLAELGSMLSRAKIDDTDDSEKVRLLAFQLSQTRWCNCDELETTPYIDGKPAGTPRRADVLWIEDRLYTERRPMAKLAKSVAQEIGKVFRRSDIGDAIKLCFDRDINFVRSYIEENFELLPQEDVDDDVRPGERQEQNDVVELGESSSQDFKNNNEISNEANGEQSSLSLNKEPEDTIPDNIPIIESDGDVNDEMANSEFYAQKQTSRKPRAVPPHIMERFALRNGFQKDNDGVFSDKDGNIICRSSESFFSWEQRNASGEVTRHYWPKDHCLEKEPLEIDAVIWGMLERSSNHVLILCDPSGIPAEVTGSLLTQLRERDVLVLHPSTYRLVIDHDKKL